jgi:hypothetical protein
VDHGGNLIHISRPDTEDSKEHSECFRSFFETQETHHHIGRLKRTHAAALKNLHFQHIPSLYGEGFFDILRGNQFHFILGVIFDPWRDNRPF